MLTVVQVFAKGLTVGKDVSPTLSNAVRPYWTACGQALQQFNTYVVSDPRVDVTVLPLFKGISRIKWKDVEASDGANFKTTSGNAANGKATNGSH